MRSSIDRAECYQKLSDIDRIHGFVRLEYANDDLTHEFRYAVTATQ